MLTLKFGGTSMGSARRILSSVDIMLDRAAQDRISVVVSAVAGVSNKLQEAIDGCVAGGAADAFVAHLRGVHADICAEIKAVLPEFNSEGVAAKLEKHFKELEQLLSGLVTFGECPANAY